MKTQDIEYREEERLLRGYLAWDEARTDRRPGILVFHENTGLTDHEKERARRLADLGYVGFACDLFGEQTAPTDPAKRREAFEEFRSKKLIPRARAGFDFLAAHPQVDLSRLGAIGFCLGGLAALELARSGADLEGVVSFHGGLTTTRPAAPDQVKARVLVCTGALDPYVTAEHVTAFENEMQTAAVDFQVNIYGGAKHGFTNLNAGRSGVPGVDYHEAADVRSWAAMRQFFEELFGPR